MEAFLLGILASLIATGMFPPLADIIAHSVTKMFGWIPWGRKVDLRGVWKSTWHVQSRRFPKRVTDEAVVVKQLGNRFYARFHVGEMDFSARGAIDKGRYVTGVWADNTEGGYHGSFQLIIDPNSRDMTGLWIGFSTKGVVKNGIWEWTRIVSD